MKSIYHLFLETGIGWLIFIMALETKQKKLITVK